ncbi:MAG: tRNA uridine-5-carboxymethylaminomethyl(34) synthesis GTPase MnmE [Bacteroidota bacterium]
MNTDTIVAPATPAGTAALHLIRLSGGEALDLVNRHFRKFKLQQKLVAAKEDQAANDQSFDPASRSSRPRARIEIFGEDFDLRKSKSHKLVYGSILDNSGRVLDEVVLSLFRQPGSYTGEDVVEISCHGSPFISDAIVRLFIDSGARLAEPGEFSMRAFLNGKMDLSQTEAVADLIASQSAAAHRLAMRQLRGGVSDAIGKLREQLIDFASLIELELDFGEEDVEFADRTQLQQLVQQIRGRIGELSDSFRLGNALKNGIPTVIAGRPNAGKSTLLNALLQEDRAIVSDVAGTTRDTIEEVIQIEGVAFRLIDTAGLRQTTDEVEAIGVERTLAKVRESQLLVYVFDVVDMQPENLTAALNELYQPETELLIVANKMDLNPYTSYEHYFNEAKDLKWPMKPDRWVPMVARNAQNLDLLRERVYEFGVGQDWAGENLILTNARHYAALQAADRDLQAVETGLASGITSDFVAMDIRAALRHLGEIAGEVSTDDLLGNIFSNFCIGK